MPAASLPALLLSEAEGEYLALGRLGEVLVLLGLRAVVEYEVRRQPVGVQEQRHAGAALSQLMDDNDAGHGVAAATAVLLVEVYAHEPGLGELLVQLVVKAVFVHPLVARLNFLLGELAHHVAYHDLLFGEIERHLACLLKSFLSRLRRYLTL